jgi:thiamine monophosphate kinase
LEFDLIEIFRRHCAVARGDVRLGIGDDAAIVAPPANHELAICMSCSWRNWSMTASTRLPLSCQA